MRFGGRLSDDALKQLLDADFRTSVELARLALDRDLLKLTALRDEGDLAAGRRVSAEQVAQWDDILSRMRQLWLAARQEALGLMAQAGIGAADLEDLAVPRMDDGATQQDRPAIVAPEAPRTSGQDAKVVELEVSQAVAERLMSWAKIFGALVAVPLTILAVVLAILGVSKWTDVTTKIDEGAANLDKKIAASSKQSQKLEAQLNRAAQKSANLEHDTEVLTGQYKGMQDKFQKDSTDFGERSSLVGRKYAEVQRQLDRINTLAASVQTLNQKVDSLSVKIEGGDQVSQETRSKIDSTLKGFSDHLRVLGYRDATRSATVNVDPKIKLNAYYDGKAVSVPPEYAGMPDMLTHEYFHKISQQYGPVVYDGEGLEVEEAVADFMALSYLGITEMGRDFYTVSVKLEPGLKSAMPKGYLRSALSTDKFTNKPDFASGSGSHANVEPWLATLWQIRHAYGCTDHEPKCDGAERLILRTFFAARKGGAVGLRLRFGRALVANLQQEKGQESADALRANIRGKGLAI